MTHGLVKLCPKVISVLEGGYELENLAKCSGVVLKALFLDPKDDKGFTQLLTSGIHQLQGYDKKLD